MWTLEFISLNHFKWSNVCFFGYGILLHASHTNKNMAQVASSRMKLEQTKWIPVKLTVSTNPTYRMNIQKSSKQLKLIIITVAFSAHFSNMCLGCVCNRFHWMHEKVNSDEQMFHMRQLTGIYYHNFFFVFHFVLSVASEYLKIRMLLFDGGQIDSKWKHVALLITCHFMIIYLSSTCNH